MKKTKCENCRKERPFMDWDIGAYTASSPGFLKDKYNVWIANELYGFKDYKSEETLVDGLNKSEKKQLWDILQKELWYRSQDALKELGIKLK